MNKRDHLKRLPSECYRGDAVVHWSITIRDRKIGWLTPLFLYRFRELLTHTCFRYGLVCPVFCLMPDHLHMLWMGLLTKSDQLLAMKHFRKTTNESLRRIDSELQDQSYDHVLLPSERSEAAFLEIFDYIARNPERAGLVPIDGYATYRFTGSLVPGYPQLRSFESDFWDQFNRIIPHIRREGMWPQSASEEEFASEEEL